MKELNSELIAALGQVVNRGASDLHVTVDAPPVMRIDGSLEPLTTTKTWPKEKITTALLSILTPAQSEILTRELELNFAYMLEDGTRFRVNYYYQRGTLSAAFRIIPVEIAQLEILGLPPSVGNLARLPRGLVLLTGRTGSGKSTTLAAIVDLINTTCAKHIVSIEDPIEFLHHAKKSIINQREVGPDTHSFSAALKNILRQDPDVIVIGELRDLETISLALTAAETGHLVFATLHTQDAPQTIDRVIDVFPPLQQMQIRTQLAATLKGVVSQTLIKRADGNGRVVATEILITTPAISSLIRDDKTYQIVSNMQSGRAQGMHTMDQHLAHLVRAGSITYEAALGEAHDQTNLHNLLKENSVAPTHSGKINKPIDFGTQSSEVTP